MSPRALARTLPKVTKPVLEKGGRDYAALIAEWAGVVGPALAGSSVPEKMTRPRAPDAGTAVLTIRVTGGAAMEFQHREPQIIERINSYLGRRAVGRLKLIQGPIPGRAVRKGRTLPPPTPSESQAVEDRLAGVDDPELKDRLARFGRTLAASTRSRGGEK